MSNKNPSPQTRFQAGNSASHGKKRGARDRITSKFLNELADDFEANGKQAIAEVREDDPGRYLQVVASLVPKEFEVKRSMQGLDDGQVDEIVDKLRAALGMDPADPEQPGAVH